MLRIIKFWVNAQEQLSHVHSQYHSCSVHLVMQLHTFIPCVLKVMHISLQDTNVDHLQVSPYCIIVGM